MPQTVNLCCSNGKDTFEARVLARRGRWVVTKDEKSGANPCIFVVSETRTGRALDRHEKKRDALKALDNLDAVCPDWMSRERWQSAEETLSDWSDSIATRFILFTASRNRAAHVGGMDVARCLDIITLDPPNGIDMEAFRALARSISNA